MMTRLTDKRTNHAEQCVAFCEQNYFSIIDYNSNMYPQRLRTIKDPPPVLYARGRLIDFDDNVCVAVVGTRSYSDSGWNATYKITSGMASGGAIIVTGLASGIDTAATRAALDSSGFAVGVLGSGLEKIFPSENRELYGEMYKRGLIITERAPFTEITGSYFPVRNRIISGLCNAVLVGEGSTRSGAMITAAHASEQGRRIFAIPADISNPESTGVNKLIRNGASPVFDASDILQNYAYLYPHRISDIAAVQITEVPEKRSSKRIRVIKGKSPVNDGMPARTEAVLANGSSDIEKAKKNNRQLATGKISEDAAASNQKNVKQNPILSPYVAAEQREHESAGRMEEVFAQDTSSLSDVEKKVYECIASKDWIVADCIGMEIGEDNMSVNIALTALEMYGLIETEGAKVRIKFR